MPSGAVESPNYLRTPANATTPAPWRKFKPLPQANSNATEPHRPAEQPTFGSNALIIVIIFLSAALSNRPYYTRKEIKITNI